MQDSWVVVGIDNGGTKNNATVADPSGEFLLDRLIESPSRVTEGPEIAVAAMVETFDRVLAETKVARERVKAVGLDTPGPFERRRRHLLQGIHQLLPPGMAQLRRARRPREAPRPPRHLQQRRQRGGAVRPRPLLRRGLGQELVRLGHRRHGPRRGCRRSRSRRQGSRGHGRRTRPRPHPHGRPSRAGPAACPSATAASTATPRASRP